MQWVLVFDLDVATMLVMLVGRAFFVVIAVFLSGAAALVPLNVTRPFCEQ